MEDTDRIDCVLRTDGMGYQEPHDLDGDEPGVAEASENRVDRVRRERDQVRGRRLRVVGAPREERQLGTAVAVPHADGPGELDARVTRDVNISTAWVTSHGGHHGAYKSPNETLCLIANGREASTMSSRPSLAGNVSSTSEWAMIEPSGAPCSICTRRVGKHSTYRLRCRCWSG